MPGALLRFILKAYVYEYCHLFLRMQLRNLCMRVHTRMHVAISKSSVNVHPAITTGHVSPHTLTAATRSSSASFFAPLNFFTMAPFRHAWKVGTAVIWAWEIRGGKRRRNGVR